MKHYVAPKLFVDRFAADTMIASSGPSGNPKNGNAGNNQNCSGCKSKAGEIDPGNPDIMCVYTPGDGVYEYLC